MMRKFFIMQMAVSCLFLVFMCAPSYAQQDKPDAELEPVSSKNKIFPVDKIPSLFFTLWQDQSINSAKNSRGVVRPPTQEELEAMKRGDDFNPEPVERDITLGGIVYHGEKDWTIWINGQRVTPDAVPKEVLDLQVFEDYIEVKWLDDHTNQVFPLRMRAHQRFNLDMRIFLPG